MSVLRLTAAVAAGTILLAGCATLGDGDDSTFTGDYGAGVVFGGNGSSYAIAVVDEAVSVEGAIFQGTATGAPVTSGTATYTGLYEVAYYTGTDEILHEDGDITLTADFDDATLTGGGGNLAIDTTISGITLDAGTVTFRGMEGTVMGGLIGADRTTGYVGGTDGGSGFAGAFLASPPG